MGVVSNYNAPGVKDRDECSAPTCLFLDKAYLPIRQWSLPTFITLFNAASSYHSIPFTKLMAVLLLYMYYFDTLSAQPNPILYELEFFHFLSSV